MIVVVVVVFSGVDFKLSSNQCTFEFASFDAQVKRARIVLGQINFFVRFAAVDFSPSFVALFSSSFVCCRRRGWVCVCVWVCISCLFLTEQKKYIYNRNWSNIKHNPKQKLGLLSKTIDSATWSIIINPLCCWFIYSFFFAAASSVESNLVRWPNRIFCQFLLRKRTRALFRFVYLFFFPFAVLLFKAAIYRAIAKHTEFSFIFFFCSCYFEAFFIFNVKWLCFGFIFLFYAYYIFFSFLFSSYILITKKRNRTKSKHTARGEYNLNIFNTLVVDVRGLLKWKL